ncbi:MAG: hypothetical protein JWM32_2973 [Verrucomicrobia bacterium]|nr:hypothetical protein [Verrucomicrobiota bacterium]
MAYILDSNTFIQAKDGFYPFDICPAFWSFVEKEQACGNAFSIRQVGNELCKGNDQLAKWADLRKHLFLHLDSAANETAKTIIEHVEKSGYTDSAKAKFLSGADPFLIAYAKTHSHKIVTHEVADKPLVISRIKIPDVAHVFGVPCVRPIDWLRADGFVMR